jgi:hypothetical protein
MNVRWDAVVDRSKMIPSPIPPAAAGAPAAASMGEATVEVWLFGSLQPPDIERPLALSLPAPATAGQVLAQLGARLGPQFLAKVLDETGAKRGHCRLFLDGHVIDDLGQPIGHGANPARIELILLMAAEGG